MAFVCNPDFRTCISDPRAEPRDPSKCGPSSRSRLISPSSVLRPVWRDCGRDRTLTRFRLCLRAKQSPGTQAHQPKRVLFRHARDTSGSVDPPDSLGLSGRAPCRPTHHCLPRSDQVASGHEPLRYRRLLLLTRRWHRLSFSSWSMLCRRPTVRRHFRHPSRSRIRSTTRSVVWV